MKKTELKQQLRAVDSLFRFLTHQVVGAQTYLNGGLAQKNAATELTRVLRETRRPCFMGTLPLFRRVACDARRHTVKARVRDSF